MQGPYYNDLLTPHISGDGPDITLAATAKALYNASMFPVLGAGFFNDTGRKIRVRAFGKITTVLTPGNGVFDIYYGTGADANGVILQSSAALTLLASQTTVSWEVDFYVQTRSLGTTGTLFCTGKGFFNTGVNAAGFFLIPAATAVVSGACDLTAALIVSLQFRRSGSTAEHMWCQDLEVTSLN
jgi:hypothetical protein